MLLLAIIFATSLCFVTCEDKLSVRPNCCGNMTFVSNATERYNCERTCDGICLERNKPGCFCKEGYKVNRLTDRCILSSDCPRYHCNEHEICPSDEVFTTCKSPCGPTCENPNPRICNFLVCNPGCDCKPSFLRNAAGKCVPQSECPGQGSQCKDPNAEYSTCGSHCPLSCQDTEPKACILSCAKGCFCKKDFIFDNVSKLCVPRNKCPKQVTV